MSFHFKNHPGTGILCALVVLGALAGWPERPIAGALIMLAVFGPMYLVGAWRSPTRRDAKK